ncbi:MAG: metallophosphoesterase [Candidatus Woesearchaeota archaeon]
MGFFQLDKEKNIFLVDLGVFLANDSILIISDLQLGYEEALNKKGFLIPRFQKNDLKIRLSFLIDLLKPKLVIFNGDVKHEFSGISKSEWRNIKEIIDFVREKSELVLIKGNHDNMLEPIIKNKVALLDYYYLSDYKIYVCHGHEIPDNKFFFESEVVIIGHEHPALGLREKGRVEKFKCFLVGRYKNNDNKKMLKENNEKQLIVLPSFNSLTEGTDILQEKLMSPFLRNVDDFEVYLVNDLFDKYDYKENYNKNSIPSNDKKNIKIDKQISEILYFGKVKSLINDFY